MGEITTLIEILVGGGFLSLITFLITRKATIRKANSEADGSELSNYEKLQNMYIEVVNKNNSMNEKISSLREENVTLKEALNHEIITKGNYMCIHAGCPLRRPSMGRGGVYYKQHKEEPTFGADFDSLEDLLEIHYNRIESKKNQINTD